MSVTGSLFLIFFIIILLGVPIGYSVGVTSLFAKVLQPSLMVTPEFVFRNMVTGLDVYSLLAVPLFILSGIIMARGGISKRLFDFFAFFFGDATAGLPIATIATCLFYGAISGSGPATVAAVGAMCIPLLADVGYDRTWVTSLIAVSGGLGVIIPPSIPFIMYGLATGTSVGNLFTAGILPGLLVGIVIMAYSYFHCKRKGEDKVRLRANAAEIRSRGLWRNFKDAFWALLSPVIILGGIYGGVVTPTEAACVSVVYALFVSLCVYKTVKLKDLLGIWTEANKTIAPIMLIVGTATVFGRVLTYTHAPQVIAEMVTSTFHSKVAVLLIINLFLLFVGCVMDTTPAILILAPILLPIVQQFGMDPVHFGVIMAVNLAIGFATPPIGINLFVASGMTKIPVLEIAKHALPFVLCFLVALMLITFIPAISLALL